MSSEARKSFSPQEYFERSKVHFDESGGDRHWTRKNFLLPYNWRHLSPGDVAEIVSALKAPVPADSSVEDLETRLAVAAVLTTGRRLAELHKLKIFATLNLLDMSKSKVGLYLSGRSTFWKLVPGKAVWNDRKSNGKKKSRPKISKSSKLQSASGSSKSGSAGGRRKSAPSPNARRVETEASDIFQFQMDRLKFPKGWKSVPLFTLKLPRLERLVGDFLRSRRGADDAEPRWVSRTPQSLERYLLQALTYEPGGDACAAARLTNRTNEINRAALSYLHWEDQGRKRWNKWWEEQERESPFSTPFLEDFVATLRIGADHQAPSAKSYEKLADYTATMLIFGLGHRGNFDFLPSSYAIDKTTGFCVLNDKDVLNPAKARLVWVPDDLREQIRRYERALLGVLDEVDGSLREEALTRLKAGELTFIDLSNGGEIMSLPRVWKRAASIDPRFERFQRNIGRHWLRTHMSGRCTSETLAAFFGHSNLGTGPWVLPSCFDPLMYRADLRRTLPGLLRDLGWIPAGPVATGDATVSLDLPRRNDPKKPNESQVKTRICKRAFRSPFHEVVLGAEAAVPRGLEQLKYAFHWENNQSDLWQLGQILASAIVNGALLDRLFWDDWLTQIRKRSEWDERFWVTMTHRFSDTGRTITKRWFADPVTSKLLDGWVEKNGSRNDPCQFEYTAEEALHEFLDTRCNCLSIRALLSWAEWRWRLRLPPLLLNHALGNTPCVAMSEVDWCAFVGKNARREWHFHTDSSRYALAKRTQEKWNEIFKTNFPVEARVFSFAARLRASGGITASMEKRLCAEGLAKALVKRNDLRGAGLSPSWKQDGHTLLANWCVHRLTQERGGAFRKGFAPSTVKYRLAAILEGLFPGSHEDSRFVIDEDVLSAGIDAAFDRYRDNPTRKELSKASKDLLSYILELNGGATSNGETETLLEGLGRSDSDTYDLPDAVSANIFSEEKFTDLLLECGTTSGGREMQLIAVLGYRAGLRLPEILGLRLCDFVSHGEIFELHVTHTRQRRLKTFSSRRILPLHVLLHDHEIGAIKDWLHTRSVLPNHTDVEPRAFGAPYSRAAVESKEYDRRFAGLFRACGIKGANFSHFRHSFASLLLLNLLLPDEDVGRNLVRVLRPSVSWERSRALKDAFLGKERIGQASLHAVSQALGHTGVTVTLRAYQHLLDVALDLHVSRKAVFDGLTSSSFEFDLRPRQRPEKNEASSQIPEQYCAYSLPSSAECDLAPSPVERRNISRSYPGAARARGAARRSAMLAAEMARPYRVLDERQHDWSVLWAVATQPRKDTALLRRAHGITSTEARSWNRLIQRILPRFILSKRADGAFTIPRGAGPQADLNKYWRNGVSLVVDDGLQRILANFLGSYDVKNGFGRVSSLGDARRLVLFLRECGVWDGSILVNAVASYLNVPAKKTGRPPHASSRIMSTTAGYPTVSFIAGAGKGTVFGRSVDITRRFRREDVPFPKSKWPDYEGWSEKHVPIHRHAIYAIKFFLVMFALRHRIQPIRLPHGNRFRPEGLHPGQSMQGPIEHRRRQYGVLTRSVWRYLNSDEAGSKSWNSSNDNDA